MQQCRVSICSEGKGNENGPRKEVVHGVQTQGKKRKSNALQSTSMKNHCTPSLNRKSILQVLDGDMLTVEHISFAQNFLQEPVPNLDGLQSSADNVRSL